MSSEPLRQMLVNPWNMKSLFTYICSTGLLDIFSLLIHILFRDLFLQQRSCILGRGTSEEGIDYWKLRNVNQAEKEGPVEKQRPEI